MLLTGILLGPHALDVLDGSILAISADLRRIALIIILTRAGLNLELADLKRAGRPAVLLCFVPACFEIAGMVLLAPRLLGISVLDAAIMGSVERRQFGLASGMIGAMRTLGMATSLTTITVIFSIYLGQQIITHSTLADFVASMKTGLILFSIYSSLGIILSISRGKQMMPGQKPA